jgi:hypothetical protein
VGLRAVLDAVVKIKIPSPRRESNFSTPSEAASLGVKRPRREADHSPPSSAEVKNE